MSPLTVLFLILLVLLLLTTVYLTFAGLFNLWPLKPTTSKNKPVKFEQLEDINIVYNRLNDPSVKNLFVLPSRAECQKRCQDSEDCEGYTYVNNPDKSDYQVCLLINDKNITRTEESGMQSGIKVR